MKKSIWRKLFASFLKLVFPAILLVAAALTTVAVLLVHQAAAPPRAAYLVTPEKLSEFTRSQSKIIEATWQNKDSTNARGWLLQGRENAPVVILLHRYGADRSWLLNMGIKLNEATGFTVLIPDQRGHGENPLVKWSGFGGAEAEDLLSAVRFLRNQKIGERIGVYGVEMGAIAALFGAAEEKAIQALALESVPRSSEDILETVVKSRASVAGEFAYQIACRAAGFYYRDAFRRDSVADAARILGDRKILLLAGNDAPKYQESTKELSKSFANPSNVQANTDLQPSGYNLVNTATSRQEEDYDRIVIDFFSQSLS